jgi:hypothetical protein
MARRGTTDYALYPRSYTVHRVPSGAEMVIDGNIDKAAWKRVPWSEPLGVIQGKDNLSLAHPFQSHGTVRRINSTSGFLILLVCIC